ncbi:MAG: DUF3796 domain-containing protein [Sphingomonadaceae bacterium]
MRRSWLRFLGFLGLLGLLSLVTSNPGFAGFFGFFGFFVYWSLVDDERLQINTARAARNAFVSALVAYPAIVVYGAFVPGMALQAYAIGFALLFTLQILVFSLSLAYYER